MTAGLPLFVQPIDDNALANGYRWMPEPGEETSGLLDYKLKDNSPAKLGVQQAASYVLGHSLPPAIPGSETGLVVGYVQSGKTLSFTAVAALARDNGYQLAIIIAGSSVQLADQSRKRMTEDLRISADRPRTWALFHNPRQASSNNIQRILDEWVDSGVPDAARQTVLITVMKQHRNLAHLTRLLQSLNLAGISALVIDDEADQASLNNEVPQGDQSTTYRRLMELRGCLPSHTLLQYTATPQAPLLINIIDTLSPNFIEVLDPGADYTGGEIFFSNQQQLVRIIPPNEVSTSANQLTGAPASLLDALRIFLLGVAAGILKDGGVGNRSMLVHPSHLTAQHREFLTWINAAFEGWRAILRIERENDPDYQELIGEFRNAYDDLGQTVDDLPAFDRLSAALRSAFNRTNIEEVNRRGGKAVIIDWRQQYAWILVGGQAMDRGFTVEGLTITYMPRGIGVGNADTIQQRARFFGYKRRYLGFCRIYLEQQTRDAFRAYVQHEEFMREQLKSVRDKGMSLNNWKRSFILDPQLRPCRNSVLEFDYVRGLFASEWFAPNIVLADPSIIAANRQLVQEFINTLNLHLDEGHKQRTEITRHLTCQDASLRHALASLLTQYKVADPIESQKLLGVLLQLGAALEGGQDEPCTVYHMSSGKTRERGISPEGRITNLFQGAVPVSPAQARGSIYAGDSKIHAPDSVTIQLHNLTLTRDNLPSVADVPVIAIWIPNRLALPWLVQDQPGQQ